MKKITFLVVLVCALALSTLAACGGPSGGGGGGNGAQTNPSVSMTGANFDVTTITITKGSTITFTDPASGGAPHILVNGENGHASPEQGAPTFTSSGETMAPGNSWTTSPWNTAGTFHVACTVHPTMNLTVTVSG